MSTPFEQQFAWIAIELGLLDQKVLLDAVREARDLRARGEDADLRSVLVRGASIGVPGANRVLERMASVPMRCPSCGREYMLTWDSHARPVCAADGAGLLPTLAPRNPMSSTGTRMHQPGDPAPPAPTPTPQAPAAVAAPPPRRATPMHTPRTPGTAQPAPSQPGDIRESPPPAARARSEHRSGSGKGGDAGNRLVGRRFGNYRLVQMIERNSKSLVFKASIDGRSEFYAVKILLVDDEKMRKRLQREGQLLTRINHPNVIDIVEVGGVDKYLYLAMEFVEGHSLQNVIEERGSVHYVEAVPWFLRILDGLGAAHAANVVHRDIKPGNIMIGHKAVKILDFGMSRIQEVHSSMTNLTDMGTTLGTPAYIAPEQLQTSKVDHRADIYSLGATLYHTLAGVLPFVRDTTIDMLMARVSEDPLPPSRHRPDIPPELDDVVLRMLMRDPDNRYPSARKAADALIAVTGG